MNQSLENKIEIKNRITSFYNANKLKIYIFVLVLVVILTSLILYKINKEKKNILVAEKYVEAGIYLASNKQDLAKSLYEEIILSNNKFYSILSLNTVIEKNLVTDNEKILKYFDILKKSITAKEQQDLLILKKALYFLKISDLEKSNKLLNNLINKNSILKPIAEEIIKK